MTGYERIDARYVRVGDHMTDKTGISGIVQGRLDRPDEVEVSESRAILIKCDDGQGHNASTAPSGARGESKYWWMWIIPESSPGW